MKKYIHERDLSLDKSFGILGKNQINFTVDDIYDFCLYGLERWGDQCYYSTYFKRCVMYYDLLKYRDKKYYPHIQDKPEPE